MIEEVPHLVELKRRIASWWIEALKFQPEWSVFERARFPRLISDTDAKSFLRGLDVIPALYRIEDGYKLFSDFLPRLNSGRDKQWNLMERHGSSHVSIRDETIVQYGVAADLVLDFGWPPDAIVCEPRTDGSLSRGPIDIVVVDEGRSRLAVEAKANPRNLDSLVKGINACGGMSARGHSDSDHKKCLGLRYFEASHLWLVAANQTRRLFEVVHQGGSVRLKETDSQSSLYPSKAPGK